MMRWLALLALLFASPANAADEIPFPDITCETTATTGTGTVDLAGALTGGYLPLATQVTSGNSVFYNIVTGTGGSRKIEVGKGVFTDAAPDTLTRVADWSTDGVGAELTLSGTSTVCLGLSGQFLNQGAGSGLNADFVDGVSSGSFALGATTLTAGTGMTGGGDLSAGRTFDVVGGVGITANADDIALAPAEMTTTTWGTNNFTTSVFSTDGVDLTWDYSTIDGAAVLSGGGTSPILAIDDAGSHRWYEEDANGSNYKAFAPSAAITTDTTCTFEDDANFIPDSCVGNGTDDGATAADIANKPESFIVAASDETTAITAAAGKVFWRTPYAFTVTGVRCSLTTAQTSGTIFTVDINESGTTILSTKVTIDNTEKTSQTAAAAPVISDSALADDAEMSIDVDSIGDSTAKGLKCELIGHQ